MQKLSVLSLIVLSAAGVAFAADNPKPAATPKAAPKVAQAQPPVTLHVGDPAPKLQLDKWLKGTPIKELEKGKVYVIECWATWCGPCIASMPHVTRMQAKYKDKGVVVIGVNVWERDMSAPEPFVKKMGDKMGYSVATDVLPIKEDGSTGTGMMASTWLQAAGRNGIPCSFLIDREGKIAWIGHPMMMERPLSMLAENKFSIEEQTKFDAQMEDLEKQFAGAMKEKNNDKALAALDQIATLNPTMASMYGTTRLSVLIRKGDVAAANALAAKLGDDDETNPASVAAALLSGENDKIDGALAVKLATKAYEANEKKGWQYENLLARAYAANHQYDKAVEMQTKAVAGVPANYPKQIKDMQEKALKEFKEKAEKK